MKKNKRLLSIVVIMVLSLVCPTQVLASESSAPLSKKGSLVVKAQGDFVLDNQTIYLYKLFDLQSTTPYVYTVNPTFSAMLQQILGVQPDKMQQTIAEMQPAQVQQFANNFTNSIQTLHLVEGVDYQTSGKIEGSCVQSYTFSKLQPGYYLVYLGGSATVNSSLVTVESSNPPAEVCLKSNVPTLTKTANIGTGQIGDVVTYTLTTTVPDTSAFSSYKFQLFDQLSTGLSFVKTASGEVVGETITITYYAQLNQDAVLSNTNVAYLLYSHNPANPEATAQSVTQTTTVRTFPLNIHKFAQGDPEGFLANIEFALYKDCDGSPSETAIPVILDSGYYKVAAPNASETTTKLVTVGNKLGDAEEDGYPYNLSIQGLNVGTYWLVETNAGNYNPLDPLKLEIVCNEDGSYSYHVDGKDVGCVLELENSNGAILPETGASGTRLFTAVGIAMILVAGAAVLCTKNHRHEK